MQNLLSLHELVKARLHCRAMHEGSVGVRADTRIPPIQSYIFMARPEDLVLYKVMPTRDIVKCSSINMTNARLISNRKHKLPSQHKFSALSCRRADRVDSGRRLHSRRPPCHLTPRTVREKHGEDTGRQWMQRSQRWWWKRDKPTREILDI